MDTCMHAFSFVFLDIGIIVCTASLLSLVLSKIRQPKVIAEVLGGILLGEQTSLVFSRLSEQK